MRRLLSLILAVVLMLLPSLVLAEADAAERTETVTVITTADCLGEALGDFAESLSLRTWQQGSERGFTLFKDAEELLSFAVAEEGDTTCIAGSLLPEPVAIEADSLPMTLYQISAVLWMKGLLTNEQHAVIADVLQSMAEADDEAAALPFTIEALDFNALTDFASRADIQAALSDITPVPEETALAYPADTLTHMQTFTLSAAQLKDACRAGYDFFKGNREVFKRDAAADQLAGLAMLALHGAQWDIDGRVKDGMTFTVYYQQMEADVREVVVAEASAVCVLYDSTADVFINYTRNTYEGIPTYCIDVFENGERTLSGMWRLEETDQVVRLSSFEGWNESHLSLTRSVTAEGESLSLTLVEGNEISFAASRTTVQSASAPSIVTPDAVRLDLLDAEGLAAWLDGAIDSTRAWWAEVQSHIPQGLKTLFSGQEESEEITDDIP